MALRSSSTSAITVLFRLPKPENMFEKSLRPTSLFSSFKGSAIFAWLSPVPALGLLKSEGVGLDEEWSSKPLGGDGVPFPRPKDQVRPPCFRENVDADLEGTGGIGISLNGLS